MGVRPRRRRSDGDVVIPFVRRILPSVLTLTLIAGVGLAVIPSTALAAGTSAVLNGYETDLVARTNAVRTAAGLPTLVAKPGLTDLARSWAARMGAAGAPTHNPDLSTNLVSSGAAQWTTAAENVAQGGASSAVFTAYLNSAPHKANFLRTAVAAMGVGAIRTNDGTVWDVMVFSDAYDDAYGPGTSTVQPVDANGMLTPPSTAPTTTTVPPTTTVVPPRTTTVPPTTTVVPPKTTTVPPTTTTVPPTTTTVPPTTTTVPPTTTTVPPTTGTVPPPAPRVGPVVGLAGKCLDVAGAQSADGTAVQLYRCNATSAQRWTVTTTGTLTALGKCLDVRGGVTTGPAPVQLYSCNGTGAQQWVARPDGSLRNPASRRCLDVPAARTADGTGLQTYACNGTAAQRWALPA